ncbi:UMP kinase [archaeon]|nr:MAG: UMP kinase [archaeon]
MRAVIKIGGHLLSTTEDFKYVLSLIRDIVELVEKNEKFKLAFIVGGGSHAREMQKKAQELNLSNTVTDEVGIIISRLNAYIISNAARDMLEKRGFKVRTKVICSIEEFLEDMNVYNVFFAGGFIPGQSTDAVASLIAEAMRADILMFLTDVDGIYDKDPKIYADAKLLKTVKVHDIMSKILSEKMAPGAYKPIDIQALKIIERSSIKCIVVNGKAKDNILNALKGLPYKGTKITP